LKEVAVPTPFEIYLPRIACQAIIQTVIDKSHYNFGRDYLYITKDYGVTTVEQASDQAIWHRIYKDEFQSIVHHHSFPDGGCFDPIEIDSRKNGLSDVYEPLQKVCIKQPFWIAQVEDSAKQVLFVKDKDIVENDPDIDSTIILIASIPYWSIEMIDYFLRKIVFRFSVQDLWGHWRRVKYIAQLDREEK
jgi:hypothetical protein